jgi:N-methylhydantoinase A/oxoprolinase/acetone carboxylase beta subunit
MAGGEPAPTQSAPCEPRDAVPVGSRPVKLSRGQAAESVPVYDGAALSPGDRLAGPALVDASDTTIWIPQGMNAGMDAARTLIVEAPRGETGR